MVSQDDSLAAGVGDPDGGLIKISKAEGRVEKERIRDVVIEGDSESTGEGETMSTLVDNR